MGPGDGVLLILRLHPLQRHLLPLQLVHLPQVGPCQTMHTMYWLAFTEKAILRINVQVLLGISRQGFTAGRHASDTSSDPKSGAQHSAVDGYLLLPDLAVCSYKHCTLTMAHHQ